MTRLRRLLDNPSAYWQASRREHIGIIFFSAPIKLSITMCIYLPYQFQSCPASIGSSNIRHPRTTITRTRFHVCTNTLRTGNGGRIGRSVHSRWRWWRFSLLLVPASWSTLYMVCQALEHSESSPYAYVIQWARVSWVADDEAHLQRDEQEVDSTWLLYLTMIEVRDSNTNFYQNKSYRHRAYMILYIPQTTSNRQKSHDNQVS